MNSDNIETTATPAPTIAEDRTVAIISYLTIIGFIVALVLFGQPGKKTALNGFHLRQNLGLWVGGIVFGIALMVVSFVLAFIPLIGPLLSVLLFIAFYGGFFVLWIMGLLAAVNGELKPVPVIGAKIQEVFKGAFI
jgi:uncharacterized membrane protein